MVRLGMVQTDVGILCGPLENGPVCLFFSLFFLGFLVINRGMVHFFCGTLSGSLGYGSA